LPSRNRTDHQPLALARCPSFAPRLWALTWAVASPVTTHPAAPPFPPPWRSVGASPCPRAIALTTSHWPLATGTNARPVLSRSTSRAGPGGWPTLSCHNKLEVAPPLSLRGLERQGGDFVWVPSLLSVRDVLAGVTAMRAEQQRRFGHWLLAVGRRRTSTEVLGYCQPPLRGWVRQRRAVAGVGSRLSVVGSSIRAGMAAMGAERQRRVGHWLLSEG
jgi:hypothetical protein